MDLQKEINKDPLLLKTPKIPSKLKLFSKTLSRHIENIRIDPFRSPESLQASIKEIIKGEIWEIPHFFTVDECQNLINETEEMGYEDATKMAGANSDFVLRNMKRIFVSDLQTAEILTSKIKDVVPICFEGGLFHGINENLKFYKYEKSEKYDRHIDGEFENELLQTKSVASFMIYLNEPKKGGITRFHSHKFENGTYDIKPETGKLLIYRQKGWLHQALPIQFENDCKFILRGDVMYRWLDNNEIGTLKTMKCGLCKNDLKVLDLFSCDHKLLSCGCVQFLEEFPEIDKTPRLGQCKWCKKKYEFENRSFFKFFNESSKCHIF